MQLNDRIFISRAGADAEASTWMATTLEAAGYTCVIQQRDFEIGTAFPINMRAAFEQCDTTVCVLSPDFFASRFCNDEWAAAYALDRGDQGRLIPVMVRQTPVPRLMAALAYLDLARMPEDASQRAAALVRAVNGVIRQGCELPDALAPAPDRIENASFETPHFTGRDAELGALHEALWSGQVAAITPPAAVTGLGGAGKSAVAREYAKRHGARYAGVWFVRAEQTAALHEDFAALAVRLDRRLAAMTDIEVAARAGARLAAQLAAQQARPFLMLFDNVELPRDIPDWVKRPGLHLIASSRYGTWPGWATAVEVSKLPPEAARVLLLETCGRTEGPGLDTLLREIDGLPLALVQAGAYLRENPGEGFGDYAAALARRIGEAPDDWPADQKLVAGTFAPSIEKAEAAAPGAREMLTGAAFLAPEGIGLELVKIEAVAGEASRRAADALARYGLWRKTGDGQHGAEYAMHRLLQTVLRAGLTADAFEAAAEAAAARLAARFEGDPDDVRTWPVNEPLASHALAVAAVTPEAVQRAALGGILNATGQFMYARADFPAAELLFKRALAIREASYGPDHPVVASSLNDLALLLQATNRAAEAEPLFKRALAIDEASYGPDHPEVATGLNNLAGLLSATNRLGEAEPLFKRALAIREASYGPDHPVVATGLNNLAGLLRATNRLGEAEPLYRRALAIDEASYGPDHPVVATDLNNLAGLLSATNRLGEAEPLFKRALAIKEASYGPDHPEVATGLNNLAGLLSATNRLGEAEPLFKRALAIREASYGPDHPVVATGLNNLAGLLRATNRLGEAEPLYRRALAIREASYGPDHPEVATDLNNLAGLLEDTNRLGEAEPLFKRALAIDEASYGPDHPEVATGLNNLAGLLSATNRLGEAEPLFKRALAIREASYGPDHPEVATGLNNLAGLLRATNRLGEAEPLYRRALAIREASYGPDHPVVATGLNNLAGLLVKTGRAAEALALLRRAHAILVASVPVGHPHRVQVEEDLPTLEALVAVGWSGEEVLPSPLVSQSQRSQSKSGRIASWFGFLGLMALGMAGLWVGMADPFGWFGG